MPMLIGVPVAATPGLGPQDEVLAVVELVPVLRALVDPAVLLLLELPPQPASANAPKIAASTANSRTREPCWYILTCLSSFVDEGANPPRLMARRA